MHQAPAIIQRETGALRAARVHETFALLDAEAHQKQKQANRELDALAVAGKLGKPDTFHTVRQIACDECGAINNAPFIDYPPAANLKMQAKQPSRERALWPGARTKEADAKSYAKRWPRLSDAARRVQEKLPVRQVAARDEI